MRSLVSDIGHLKQRVRGEPALNGKIPLLVVIRFEWGRISADKALSDGGKQALRAARRIDITRRERIADQIVWVDAIQGGQPGGGGGERRAGNSRVAPS